MKVLLQRVLKWLAYTAAALVILLAVAVGVFRLMLPRLPQYQDEIKAWATQAIGLKVEFSGMDARWRLSGPELNFYDASLELPGNDRGTFEAGEVSVGVGLIRLIVDRTLVVDRVGLRAATVDISRDPEGNWAVQDIPVSDLRSRFTATPGGRDITVVAEEINLRLRDAEAGADLELGIDGLRIARDGAALDGEMVLELPPSLGDRVQVTAGERLATNGGAAHWNVTLESRDLRLPGLARLLAADVVVPVAGTANLSLAIEWYDDAVRNAVADVEVTGLQAPTQAPVSVRGKLAYQRDDAGWLLAAEQLQLTTDTHRWPEGAVRLQGATDADGALRSLHATASYVDLVDVTRLQPWLPAAVRQRFTDWQPTGTVTDVDVTLGDLTATEPRFDIAMMLADAGVAASDNWPGVRGVSGSVRATRSGGRVEIDSSDAVVDLSRWLPAPVQLARAAGTIIWRHNRDDITVLSDSIVLDDGNIDSRSSLQISLPSDGRSPVVDLESHWSIGDIGAARQLLPQSLIKPSLYRWLNGALVAGRVTEGTTRFSGPLDRFPFDNGEGVFRVDATLDAATLRYSDQWPDVQNLDLDLVVDRTRLYSTRNTAVNAGNSVVDAKIEIADLRKPLLTIDARATGTMESIRRFARQSPIADVFGGHLDDVSVDGNASFTLNLSYPIYDRSNYDFTTRIRPGKATLRIAGLAPPVTELNGVVVISRHDIAADKLTGRFLGAPVRIDLHPAGDVLPGYSVVADVEGALTPAGVADGFGLSLANIVRGATPYHAELRFPMADQETPQPLAVTLDSNLDGLEVLLPAPLRKSPEATRALTADIRFPGGARIETQGRYGDDLGWNMSFAKSGDAWDFDRGIVAMGNEPPGTADTRGLHITGHVPALNLHDWLASSTGSGRGSIADRIRRIDLDVDNLYVLGQHFTSEHIVVDRGASAWVAQVDGDQALGTVSIPFDFGGDRPLAIDMQRLTLPGSDDGDGNPSLATDPRTVPPLSIKVGDFAFGERHLGKLQADFVRDADGIVARDIHAEDDSFEISGNASWGVDVREPTGQRTKVVAVLKSHDVGKTMQRLNSRPGIQGDDMQVQFDVSWSGGPREDFLDSLDGDFEVRFGTGQLVEVEPGAGRMFGLMSVVALPRRLSLDFRDVLDKGFVFDEITGTFRVENGNAYTCDLSLKGPAADIGIVGRAGLDSEDYDQAAIVSANVGNTLPVVGAVVAGPQVAAALLIFSQIFKKPLQEMGQAYYTIEGGWDQPEVDSANIRRFARASELAECIDNGN